MNSLTAIRRRWVRLTTKIASGVSVPARSRSLVEGAVPRVSLPERATTVTTSMTCGKTVAVISATLAKRPTEPIAARPTPGS